MFHPMSTFSYAHRPARNGSGGLEPTFCFASACFRVSTAAPQNIVSRPQNPVCDARPSTPLSQFVLLDCVLIDLREFSWSNTTSATIVFLSLRIAPVVSLSHGKPGFLERSMGGKTFEEALGGMP